MSGIFKPINPKYVDSASSLMSGLVFDSQLQEGSGTTNTDLMGGLVGNFANSPTWLAPQRGLGIGVGFTGSDADAIAYTSTPAALNDIHTISVETMAIMDATPGNGIRIMHKGNASRRYFENLEHDAGNMYCAGDWSGSQGAWSFSASLITTGTPFHHIVTYDDSLTTNDPIVYLNGTTPSLTEVVTPTGTRSADVNNLNIGNSFSAATSWKGTIFYVRIWNRILTPTEALLLYANPWRLYGQNQKVNNLRPNIFAPGLAR